VQAKTSINFIWPKNAAFFSDTDIEKDLRLEPPVIPANEDERHASLCQLNILDTDPEEGFDRLTRLAQSYFKVPIALVSLVDSQRQWFKSRQGLDATETPRDISFCGHAILGTDIFCVPDTLEDPRFRDNPLVTSPPSIRFYAGAPLSSPDGMKVGTLCIIDTEPRIWSGEDARVLRDLADCVEKELGQAELLDTTQVLASQESRLRAVLDTVIDGIVTIDQKGMIETFNPAAERIFGYAAEEVVGQNVKCLMPEPYHSEHDGYLKNFHDSGEAKVIGIGREVIGRRKDGSTFPMELAVGKMEIDGTQMFTGIVRDIGERKDAERKISAIMKAVESSQLVAEFAMDGTIITANDLFCNTMGYQLEMIQGEHHSIFLSPLDKEDADYQAFWAALNQGKFQTGEFKRIGKGGKEVWLHATYTPILDPQGAPLKVMKFATDISETVFSRKQLRDSEDRTRAIVNTVIDGIVTIDQRGNIETFNPAAERVFGYAADEVVGQNVKCLMPEPYHSEHDGYLKNFHDSREAKVIGIGREVVGQRKDGSTFPMELAVGDMEVGGVKMFTGIVRDISDRKQAEKLKTEFISTVSHELRTPLTSIKASLGLIRTGGVGDLPKKLGRMLEIAYSNSDRLVRLINDILDIEKIAAGKMDFMMEPMDITALLVQAIDANKGYGQEHGVSFALSCDLSDAMIEGDHDRLMQVLANLMSNAAKFSPEGEPVVISLSQNNGGYRVSVADRGPGIPEDFRDKIFGKFHQADSSDTRQKGGTGLGLNITKAIVEQHGGSIGFETEIGKGTTFFFDLPELQEREVVVKTGPTDGPQYHVLICEDDGDIATLLQMMLTQDGYTTDIARNAADAERLLATTNYDAMTLDLGLPDKDGITLIRELRETPKTKDLPIIVISAKADAGAKELNGDAIGVIDWLEKPIDRDRLMEDLRRAITASPEGHAHVLHVEDDPDIRQIVASLIGDLAETTPAKTLSEAKSLLERHAFDLVILDLMLPDGNGEEILSLLKKDNHKSTPVIVFSGQEISKSTVKSIEAVLVKSKTTNEALLDTIRSSIEARKVPHSEKA